MRRLLVSCTSQLSCVSNTGVQKRAGKWVLHSSVFRIRKPWWEWGGGMEGQGEPQDSSPIWCDGLKREAVNLKLHCWKRKSFRILTSPSVSHGCKCYRLCYSKLVREEDILNQNLYFYNVPRGLLAHSG